MGVSRTSPKDINAAQRAKKALELRMAGLSLAEIAVQCGYADPSGPHRAIAKQVKAIPQQAAEEMRQLEAMREDKLYNVAWAKAIDPTAKGQLFALDRLQAITEWRTRTFGLTIKEDQGTSAETIIRQYDVDVGSV